MEKNRILICDDEAGIRQLIKVFLIRYHYEVLEAATAAEMFEHLKKDEPDLIILDLMLPDMYGIDACKQIRENSEVPIIMLTAVQGEMNTVLGFEAGADDYVEKPFSAHVLLSRIQAILKRTKAVATQASTIAPPSSKPKKPTYEKAAFAGWTFIPSESCIQHASGKHVFLTKNESILLNMFLEKEQEILTRDAIAEALHLDTDDIESRAIDVQISRLRNKLKDKTQNNLIKSIRNKGYLLTVPVRLT